MEEWKEEVAWFIAILVLVFGIQYGLRFVLHTNTPLVIVVSGSMEPVFYRGDVVVLEGVKNPHDIKVGDVIVYKRPGYEYPIIHRVRYIGNVNGHRCFVTWGDNNPGPDPPDIGIPPINITLPGVPRGWPVGCVPSYDIEDKAIFVIPKVGLIPLWVRTFLGLSH